MAVALNRADQIRNSAMTQCKTLLLAALAAALFSTAAKADWSSASNYNGYGASNQNTASNFSLRDGNGNLTLVNGQFTGPQFSSQSGVQNANAMGGGVGMQGAGTMTGQATAIGNSLNVEVIGSHNTTVIDTTQINNGNQTATTTLNAH